MSNGRFGAGAKNPMAKLTSEQVEQVIDWVAERERLYKRLEYLTNEAIGKRLGVSDSCIGSIATGQTWRKV